MTVAATAATEPRSGSRSESDHASGDEGAAAATTRTARRVNILAVSDHVAPLVYSDRIRERFGHVDLVLSCGDLPLGYLDFIVSTLNVPLYGVPGNHDHGAAFSTLSARVLTPGTTNLHGRAVRAQGLTLAGLGGSLRYNGGPWQWSEAAVRRQLTSMMPRLLLNKLRYGRWLDILVTHAPPRHVHDGEDRCHQGFEAFLPFLRHCRPRYHLHGHVHVYDNRTVTRTRVGDTVVLNAYGYREVRVSVEASPLPPAV